MFRNRNRGRAIALGVVIGGLAAGGAAAGLAAFLRQPQGVIANPVVVGDLQWSGKKVADAEAELRAWYRERLGDAFPLTVPPETGVRKVWRPIRADVGAVPDVKATMSAVASASSSRGPWARMAGWLAGRRAEHVAPRWRVDKARVAAYLRRSVAPSVRIEERDARVALQGGELVVRSERAGRKLDAAAATAVIAAGIGERLTEPLTLPVTVAVPRVSAADVQGIDGEVASYRTRYSERGNRRTNLIVACSRINGVVLKPGDVFSYNGVVGPRDAEAGFRMAPVIIRGRLEPGIGGGICQVSSTLYNAVLMADLEVVSRSHHAFPVHYLPAGRDATVAYGAIDFRFRNNTDRAIAILADASGQQVSMRVFGRPTPGRTVTISRTGVSSWGQREVVVNDSALKAGKRIVRERGHAGHSVTVWRTVKQNGVIAKRERISSDTYSSFPRIVVVGSAPVAPSNPTGSPTVPTGLPVPEPSTGPDSGTLPPQTP